MIKCLKKKEPSTWWIFFPLVEFMHRNTEVVIKARENGLKILTGFFFFFGDSIIFLFILKQIYNFLLDLRFLKNLSNTSTL